MTQKQDNLELLSQIAAIYPRCNHDRRRALAQFVAVELLLNLRRQNRPVVAGTTTSKITANTLAPTPAPASEKAKRSCPAFAAFVEDTLTVRKLATDVA